LPSPPNLARYICRMLNHLPSGYCLFIQSVCDGPIPALTDGDGNYVVFATEQEAQKEIADNLITRLQEFIADERDFVDALTIDEYILPVTVAPDGTIADAQGNVYKSRRE